MPGQYVRIGVDVDGVRLWRTYSLTHGPRPDGCISLTVKAIPGGVVSHHLVRRSRPGQMVQLQQAEGEFVLPQPLPPKLLLVTAGSGITPVIGMLRNLFSKAEAPATDIVLVHVNVDADAAIFRDELRAHAAAGHLTLVERYDAVHGMLDVAHPEEGLATLVPDLHERLTYACGPAGLLDALEAHHAEHGLSLTTERFRPVVLADLEGLAGGPVSFADGTLVEADGATPDPRRRRGPRRAHAQRLPDGHLHGLRAAADRRRRPRPAQRRPHRRRARRDRARAACPSRPASTPPPAPAPSTTDLHPLQTVPPHREDTP